MDPTTKRLRSAMTSAEAAMWTLLRDRRLDHLKFRRQTRIGPWVADFCCYELKLVIELDGGVHVLREAEDAARDADLRTRGFEVVRCSNDVVLTNPNAVFDVVRRRLEQAPPHPSRWRAPPSPTRGEGEIQP